MVPKGGARGGDKESDNALDVISGLSLKVVTATAIAGTTGKSTLSSFAIVNQQNKKSSMVADVTSY